MVLCLARNLLLCLVSWRKAQCYAVAHKNFCLLLRSNCVGQLLTSRVEQGSNNTNLIITPAESSTSVQCFIISVILYFFRYFVILLDLECDGAIKLNILTLRQMTLSWNKRKYLIIRFNFVVFIERPVGNNLNTPSNTSIIFYLRTPTCLGCNKSLSDYQHAIVQAKVKI